MENKKMIVCNIKNSDDKDLFISGAEILSKKNTSFEVEIVHEGTNAFDVEVIREGFNASELEIDLIRLQTMDSEIDVKDVVINVGNSLSLSDVRLWDSGNQRCIVDKFSKDLGLGDLKFKDLILGFKVNSSITLTVFFK